MNDDMLNDLLDMSSAPQEPQASYVDSFKLDSQTCDKNGDIHTTQKTMETICNECEGLGVVLVEGDTYAKPIVCKSCSQDGGYTARGYDFNFDIKSFYSQKVRIPNNYILQELDKNSNYRVVEHWYKSIEQTKNKSLLITGMPGLGKTLLSNIWMLQYLKNKKERIGSNSCFSTSTREILEVYNFYNNSRTTHFSTTQENSDKYSSKKKWECLKNQCKEAEFLIIDEIGLDKKEEDALLDIIAHRENSNKITIYTSNLDFEKEYTINKKTIRDILGVRIESRLRTSKHVRFKGNDKRDNGDHLLTKEEIMSFELPEVIRISIENYESHMLNWIISNPIFENIDSKKRQEETEIIIDNEGNEIIVDLYRPSPKVVKSLWYKDDVLTIDGPRCDIKDALLYQKLLNLLAIQHKEGGKGIRLYYRDNMEIIKLLSDKKAGGSNYKSIVRRLLRLKKIDLTYYRKGQLRWTKGLIKGFDLEECYIDFNESMIPFYNEKGSFTIYDMNRIDTLSGCSALIFYFLYSQHDHAIVQKKDLQFWKDLLSIERYKYDKKIDTKIRDIKVENRTLKKYFLKLESILAIERGSVEVSRKGVKYKMTDTYKRERIEAQQRRKKKIQ